MRLMILAPAALIAATLVGGCTKPQEPAPQGGTPAPGAPPGPPMPGGPPGVPTGKADPVAGKKVFDANCAVCHGASGQGVMKGTPNFTSEAWQKEQNDADLLKTIHNGQGKMPAWKGRLSEKDIADAEAFVRTLGKPKAK